jgi:hypothetical protein
MEAQPHIGIVDSFQNGWRSLHGPEL